MPTIRDVAAAAGVSVTTVSRVLNSKDDVSPETVARVRAVIDEMGFASSLAASSMRSRRTWVIGIVVPDIDHSWAVEIVKAASRAVTGTRYDLFIMTSGKKSHLERGRWEQQQVARLNGTLIDGIIVAVPDSSEFRTEFPLVIIDPYPETTGYPTIVADNYGAGLDVMHALLALGHQRIGFIGGFSYLESAIARHAAYRDTLSEAGIALDPALETEGEFSVQGGEEAARALLSLPEPPTAIFAANDDMAFGVLAAAKALGVQIPRELSLIGFDNVPESAQTVPPLTTVDQDIDRLMRTAFQMLQHLIEGTPLSQEHVTVPAQLIVRDSCAPPRTGPLRTGNSRGAPPTANARPL
jgi:LacI family transcriptional regulator